MHQLAEQRELPSKMIKDFIALPGVNVEKFSGSLKKSAGGIDSLPIAKRLTNGSPFVSAPEDGHSFF